MFKQNHKAIPVVRAVLASASLVLATSSMAQQITETPWKQWNQGEAAQEAQKRIAEGKDPIPGPRNCFWRLGPFSGDPYINIAYPDTRAFYWGVVFTMPAGSRLYLDGKFPRARYMSFNTYDGVGAPVDAIADYLIKPNANGINPFASGADRSQALSTTYRVEVLDSAPANPLRWGIQQRGTQRNTVHAPKYGPQQQALVYRIYAGDKGTDETGSGGLPEPVLVTADGKEVRGAQLCAQLRTVQPLTIDPAALAVPMDQYQKLVDAARVRGGPNFPATNPAFWSKSSEDTSRFDIYTGGTTVQEGIRKTAGTFYANLDNQYVRSFVNRRLGKVVVVRAKAPTVPKTWNGNPLLDDSKAELRYWSICSNEGFATARANLCLFDEQIPVAPNGYFTVVISRVADRPRNATAACGVAWLPMSEVGDGADDPDMTLVVIRHMLGSNNFKHAVQNIKTQTSIEQDMGDYFPRIRYTSTQSFETAVPCLVEKR